MERGASTGTRIKADQVTESTGGPDRAISERILVLAGQAGAKAALIDAVTGTVTAWPRLARTIRAGAHGLSRRGLAPGDTAAVFVQDAASFIVAVNAIRATGARAVLIGADAALADIAAQLNASGARLLITAVPLAELATEAADRSRVRQVFAFGEAAGTTSFRSLLSPETPETGNPLAETCEPAPDECTGLSHRDVVVTGPPCGQGQAYISLLDRALLAGATVVAAPIPLITATMRVYRGTAAIVPAGTSVPGLGPDRIFTVA